MAHFENPDLAQRVAVAIRQSVAGKSSGEVMPSLRSISLKLAVSVPTVARAFSILQADGVLESCGERRRWKVSNPDRKKVAPVRASAGPRQIKRLLFLSGRPMNEWLSNSMEVYADLVSVMSSHGWEVFQRVMGYEEAKSPRKSWDDLLEQEKPDAVVALRGRPVLAQWAAARSVPILFLGGSSGDIPLPMVRVGITGPLEELIHRLIDRGHRQIVMPLCGRSPEFLEKIKASFRVAMVGRDSSGAVIHALETPYSTAAVLYDLLRKHWRHYRPDAMILLDWREFVTASSFFRDVGVSIPRDLSVVMLSNDHSMDWHLPRIAHYEFSTLKLAKAVARWALSDDRNSPSTAKITMRAQWRDGGTLGDRR